MGRWKRRAPLPIFAAAPNAVCEMLGVLPRDIKPGIDNGAIPVMKLGTRRRIFLADAEKYIREHNSIVPNKGADHAR